MRVLVVSLFLFSILAFVYGQAPDLPPAAGSTRTPTMVTFAAGSLIIDMGDYQIEDTNNTGSNAPLNHQLTIGHVYPCGESASTINCTDTSTTCTANSWCGAALCGKVNASRAGQFNLYAYGLAIRILYQKIPLFWAIKSGKTSTTDYDIVNVEAYRSHPTRSPQGSVNWGSTSNSTMSFRGGPILIRAADAPAALAVLNSAVTGYGSTKGRFESIVIFTLANAATIDVRHNLTHLPYVYSSTLDGSWCDWSPIPMILMNAGLLEGPINNISTSGTGVVNQHHWSLLTESADLIAFSNSTCSTLFAEPHIIFDNSGNCAAGRCVSTPQYRAPLSEFIQSGGNFWVQCAGIASYENSLWNSQYYPPPAAQQQGAFISKYGIQGQGNTGNEWGGRIDSVWQYENPDLPISQFVGNLGNQSGTISGFYLRSDPAPTALESALWANNGFSIASTALAGGSASSSYNSVSLTEGLMGPCSRCCPNATAISPKCTYNNTLPAGRTHHIAAGSKLTNPYNANSVLGGLVWMVGGHSWFTDYEAAQDSSFPSQYVEDINLRNGQRMFLNALLVPAVRPANCLHNFCSQDVDCTYQYGTGYSCISSTCSASSSPSVSWSPSQSPSVSLSSSRSPTPTISISGSHSFSGSTSFSQTASVTPTTTVSLTSTASATPSRSQTPTASPTSGASQTPSTTASLTKTSTQTPSTTTSLTNTASLTKTSTQTPSTTTSLTNTASLTKTSTQGPSTTTSLSSSPSVSVTASTSLSRSPSYSPSNTPSASETPSPAATPSTTPSPVALAGGGGSNTGTIVGAVVGAVGGAAVVGGVVAAGAAAAVVIAKKAATAPLDSGALSGADAFNNTIASPVYTPANNTVENPLYAS